MSSPATRSAGEDRVAVGRANNYLLMLYHDGAGMGDLSYLQGEGEENTLINKLGRPGRFGFHNSVNDLRPGIFTSQLKGWEPTFSHHLMPLQGKNCFVTGNFPRKETDGTAFIHFMSFHMYFHI